MIYQRVDFSLLIAKMKSIYCQRSASIASYADVKVQEHLASKLISTSNGKYKRCQSDEYVSAVCENAALRENIFVTFSIVYTFRQK